MDIKCLNPDNLIENLIEGVQVELFKAQCCKKSLFLFQFALSLRIDQSQSLIYFVHISYIGKRHMTYFNKLNMGNIN